MSTVTTEPSPSPAAEPIGRTGSLERWPKTSVVAWRAAKVGAIVGGLGLLLLSRVPVCPVANLTGFPCPGCGLTRATLAACTGHFADALHLHPLVFFATPMLSVWALSAAHSYLKRGRVLFSDELARVLMPALKALYAALILLWVVRFFGVWGGPVPVGPSLVARFF